MKVSNNIEREKKYLIQGINKSLFKGVSSRNIKQYYLNIDNGNIRRIIKLLFNLDEIGIRMIAEARVRSDGSGYVMTIKSGALNDRYEQEKSISKESAMKMINSNTIGYVAKTRFIYKGVEIDFFKNQDLCLAEMEYSNMTEQEVDEYVAYVIKEIAEGKAICQTSTKITNEVSDNNGILQLNIPTDIPPAESVMIVDVTNDARYKNRNLMTPCNSIINKL